MKIRLILAALLLGLTVVGCRNKQSQNQYIAPAGMEYSGKDTTEIMGLVNKYVQCLNEHDYDGMVDLLHTFKDNRIYAFDETQRDSVKRGLQQIPVYAAKLYSFRLNNNVNNKICILVQLIENGDLEQEIGVSKLFLNPVYVQDKWYLTLLDLNADGVKE